MLFRTSGIATKITAVVIVALLAGMGVGHANSYGEWEGSATCVVDLPEVPQLDAPCSVIVGQSLQVADCDGSRCGFHVDCWLEASGVLTAGTAACTDVRPLGCGPMTGTCGDGAGNKVYVPARSCKLFSVSGQAAGPLGSTPPVTHGFWGCVDGGGNGTVA